MGRMNAKRWCFTLNNPTDEDRRVLKETFTADTVEYMIMSDEVGKSGTPHIQGFIHFKSQKRLTALRKIIQAHFSIARGTDEQNQTYCSKQDQTPYTVGQPCQTSDKGGRKTVPIATVVNKLMINDDIDLLDDQELEVYGKHMTTIKSIMKLKRSSRTRKANAEKFEELKWYDWQKEILEIIKEEPSDRCIHWYWEDKGNVGKTSLAMYLETKGALRVTTSKTADIKYTYNGQPIVVFDYARAYSKFYNYGVMEELKNGGYLCGKYHSSSDTFPVPHIFVFANTPPEEQEMSADRWLITNIGDKDEPDHEAVAYDLLAEFIDQ